MKYYSTYHNVSEIIPISALKSTNISLLEDNIYKYLPNNPFQFIDDTITTNSIEFSIKEIVREKIMRFLGDELPYSTSVDLLKLIKNYNNYYINITIIIYNKNHKAIIVGKDGTKIKQISYAARMDIQKFFNQKVHLFLWVKFAKNNLDKIKN
jgi:GTP-binding protein Era